MAYSSWPKYSRAERIPEEARRSPRDEMKSLRRSRAIFCLSPSRFTMMGGAGVQTRAGGSFLAESWFGTQSETGNVGAVAGKDQRTKRNGEQAHLRVAQHDQPDRRKRGGDQCRQ
jgi:hypothetical protein